MIIPWWNSSRERLRRTHVAEVVQTLVPEARVQEVQDPVLGAADVQVDAFVTQPIALGGVAE